MQSLVPFFNQLATGANPNIPDYDEEKTPLHVAAANGYGKVGTISRISKSTHLPQEDQK